MAIVKKQDVCYAEKYTSNGEAKTRWHNVGKAFHNENGNISIKLNSIPVGDWDGYLNLFDERNNNQAQANNNQRADLPF